MNVAVRLPPRQLTVPEFLEWHPDDGRKWQLFDGTPRPMAPSKRRHGAIQAELAALIRNHLLETGSRCVVVTEPGIVPRVNADQNFRIPDLAVTCTEEGDDEPTLEDPVLIVEVLSVGNARETMANLWAYTTIPSVQEILVLRTVRVAAELLRRRPDGSWPENAEKIADGAITLESIGLTLPLGAPYRTTKLAK